MTSHDVVDEVRAITGEKTVGHAGTLDPFATGVLIVGIGREDTKKLGQISKDTEKEYEATLLLGETSTTGDPEGTIETTANKKEISQITEEMIQAVLKTFKGEVTQTPPAYSAIKIKGVPAYKLARKGQEVQLPERKITIYDIQLLMFNSPTLKLRISCSAGTYIRTLAQDIGKELGTDAYVKELTRTRVGGFTIEKSISLSELSLEKNIQRLTS
ncbi:tRNA pseudouridine(55) synthase TruB [Patescibacteria group bacterium]|nr:tRNA pseudouridine(55) synthase TruB [Patescibacteria group bacterium]